MALLSLKVTAAVSVAGATQPGTVQVRSAKVSVPTTIGLVLNTAGAQGAPGVGASWKGLWTVGTTYALADGVTASDGHNYISLVAGNLAHNPVGDGGVHWSDLLPSNVVTDTRIPEVLVAPPTGVSATDDAAVAAAIAKLSGGPGILQFQNGAYSSANQYSFDDRVGVRLRGAGGTSGGAAPGTSWTYTGTAASFISARSVNGFDVADMQILYSNASFTGLLFDFSHSGGLGTDAAYITFQRCGLAGSGIRTGAVLLSLDDAIIAKFQDTTFANATRAVNGRALLANYAETISFENCTFTGFLNPPILNPGDAWSFIACTFENLVTGSSGAGTTAGAGAVLATLANWHGLSFTGCWFGDANTTGNWIQLDGAGGGLALVGNFIGAGHSAIKFDAAVNGLVATGNYFTTMADGFSVSSTGNTDWLVIGNLTASISGSGLLSYGAGGVPDRSIIVDPKAATSDMLGMLRLNAGVVSDGIFPQAPPNGTMAVDTTNNKLYVRYGGAWKSTTLT